MNNMSNLPPEQLDAMLNIAGQKLGRDPQTLKSQLQSGQIDQVTQGMSPQQRQQIGAILSDRQALGKFLENPQIKQMLSQLMKGK
ncbi:MAG: hypothetical protein RR320_04320 [Oscillospiraceae bacterium]